MTKNANVFPRACPETSFRLRSAGHSYGLWLRRGVVITTPWRPPHRLALRHALLAKKAGFRTCSRHIHDSIEAIELSTRRATKKKFLATVPMQDAVLRRLEVIGEAVKNLPSDFRTGHPTVPWKRLAGLRDVLIHQYFGVDIDLVWEIVQKDFPKLKHDIRKIIGGIS